MSCQVCSDACLQVAGETSYCGDGVVDVADGEECDDGNTEDGDGCSSECAPVDGWRCDDQEPTHCEFIAPCESAEGGCPDLDFVFIEGGAFTMGGMSSISRPAHRVNVPDFELMRTEVTVAQYRACVDAGACDPPNCNRERSGRPPTIIVCNYSQDRDDHPVNFVSWLNARQFAAWVGARLPSESEWEYAARSGGQDIDYPWGDDEASCLHADIWNPNGNPIGFGEQSCGGAGTSAVCSRPEGNSDQGVCDLIGNVREWLQDEWHRNYVGAPVDGSAWGEDTDNGAKRCQRGGYWRSSVRAIFSQTRRGKEPDYDSSTTGFRLARD